MLETQLPRPVETGHACSKCRDDMRLFGMEAEYVVQWRQRYTFICDKCERVETVVSTVH